MKKILARFLTRSKPQTSPTSNVVGFDPEALPYLITADFRVVSTVMGEMRVYAVMNTVTGHLEMVYSQLSAAVINMQTAQQTLDRVRTGEANGYFNPDNIPSQG